MITLTDIYDFIDANMPQLGMCHADKDCKFKETMPYDLVNMNVIKQ